MHHGRGIERFGAVRGFRSVMAVLRRLSNPARALLRCLNSGCGSFVSGAVTTAPPKPSVQTQILLTQMEERAQAEDAHWDSVMESLDLLFTKVATMENCQQRVETQLDVSARVMEQVLLDQQTLAKQMESTGNAVAQLTINQMRSRQDRPPNPASSDSTGEIAFR